MDMVIGEINDALQSNFPILSDWADYAKEQGRDMEDYSVIPDRYLRTVVAVGAALNFFTNDEEGEQIANKYYIQYERAKSTMVRDFIELVPEEFQVNEGGYISTPYVGRDDSDASIEGIVINSGFFNY